MSYRFGMREAIIDTNFPNQEPKINVIFPNNVLPIQKPENKLTVPGGNISKKVIKK